MATSGTDFKELHLIELPRYFQLTEEADEAILDLLKSVELGTDGTIYRHLNTDQRVKEIDNPLFLSLRRSERVLGNITFCKRSKDWYVRYFAFDNFLHAASKNYTENKRDSLIKSDIERFFKGVLNGEMETEVERFYAYIDPRNNRSLNLALQFGFSKERSIATQTYSRVRPRSSYKLKELAWKDVVSVVEREYGEYKYFHTELTEKGPILGLFKGDQLFGFAKITTAEWKIEQFPGKYGQKLLAWIPKIPLINRLIKPERHAFIVPEAIYVRNNDPKLLKELFNAILQKYDRHLIIWWVDEEDCLYKTVRKKMSWGILHRFLGVNKVHLMVRSKVELDMNDKTPAYICGIDFV